MAAVAASAALSVPTLAAASQVEKTEFAGAALPSLAVTKTAGRSARPLHIVASGGKKTVTKTPFGPSGDTKVKVDASGRQTKGKGTYQFAKKYGANVDGYSPIYNPDEWSKKGDVYEGGQAGIALWAVTFAALLAVGVVLVYSTSSLSS